jgi:6-phosphogluconolactonase (cycloisomerase 2 family)
VSEFGRRADWSEGRRGSRIDLEEGGRYLGIPQIGFADTLSSVTINPVSTNSGAVHLSQDVRLEGQTPYGRKYSIHATLVGPSGSSADMVSVWIVRTGDELPRS